MKRQNSIARVPSPTHRSTPEPQAGAKDELAEPSGDWEHLLPDGWLRGDECVRKYFKSKSHMDEWKQFNAGRENDAAAPLPGSLLDKDNRTNFFTTRGIPSLKPLSLPLEFQAAQMQMRNDVLVDCHVAQENQREAHKEVVRATQTLEAARTLADGNIDKLKQHLAQKMSEMSEADAKADTELTGLDHLQNEVNRRHGELDDAIDNIHKGPFRQACRSLALTSLSLVLAYFMCRGYEYYGHSMMPLPTPPDQQPIWNGEVTSYDVGYSDNRHTVEVTSQASWDAYNSEHRLPELMRLFSQTMPHVMRNNAIAEDQQWYVVAISCVLIMGVFMLDRYLNGTPGPT
jgi:hypothetical protein